MLLETNRKGFELAISTLVIVILGIIVLIGLILIFTGGIDSFKGSTEPFLDTTLTTSIRQACSQACELQDKLTYCCKKYEIETYLIKCSDSRLELDCPLDCSSFQCSGQTGG